MNRQVKTVESAADNNEAKTADRGGNKLSAHANCPSCAVRHEQADETSDVAAPATRKDGRCVGERSRVKHVHFLAVVCCGRDRGLRPRTQTESTGTPAYATPLNT
jgi:hypothetical protein